jgi:outer membrane protein OmpA-like peptidoglycan-associated protein
MNEFEELTLLLTGKDTVRLDRLEKRLDDAHQRSLEIATLLPAALRALPDKADFIKALQIPVDDCLKKSINADPHSFVKAILPVEKPLLRKTVIKFIKPMNTALQAQQTQLKELKKFLEHSEKIHVNQQKQQSKFIKQVDELEQKNTNKINHLKKTLETQLNELEEYFDKLEKVQINQHLQLSHLNEHFSNRFEKTQTEQQAQFSSTNTLVKENFQKLESQISQIDEQLDIINQEQLNSLRNRINRFEEVMVRYEQLESRINDTKQYAKEIAKILPDAIRRATEESAQQTSLMEQRLIVSLQKPIEMCLKESIRQDSNAFAQSLFPVIGPMIRKYTNEGFKTLLQQINSSLENAFSLQHIIWRIQALHSGHSYSEMVLKNTLVYRVEQVFLIHRESGLLVHHTHIKDIEIGDSDAVSAMFTAIQDFTRDSFSASKKEELDSVEVGEYTVWIERGPYALLACVIRGVAPLSLRENMSQLIEKIHGSHGKALREFEGDNTELQSCFYLLEEILESEIKTDSKMAPRLFSLKFFIITVIILIMLLTWGYHSFSYQQRLDNYINALYDTPGIIVISTQKQEGKLVIHGMRDPLAAEPQKIAYRFELNEDNVLFKGDPYQDLHPNFVEKRLIQWLKPPKTVQMYLKVTTLHLSGHADQSWIDKVKNSVGMMAGFSHLVTDKLRNTRALFQDYIKTLNNTPGIIVVSSGMENDQRFVTGLRDPLSESPEDIAKRMQISDMSMRWTSYQDLTPSLVEKRAYLRLAPPSTVQLHVQGDTLYLSGHAPQKWIEKAMNNAKVAGINHLKINDLVNSDQVLLAEATYKLTLPDNVTFTVQDGILKVEGQVNSANFHTLQDHIQKYKKTTKALVAIDTSLLINIELEIRKLTQRIQKTVIYFVRGKSEIILGQEATWEKLNQNVQKLLAFSKNSHQSVLLEIMGNTDGIGAESYNRQLALERAQVIYNGLWAMGIKKDNMIIISPTKIRFGEYKAAPNSRNVSFRVIIKKK